MKSKKIIAVVVALASMLAMATSGLAATTTEYVGDYVKVTANVPATAGEQVTYLVKGQTGVGGNADKIVYIDQVVAGAEGADFEYSILKSNLSSVNPVISVSSNKIADEDIAVPTANSISEISIPGYDTDANVITTFIRVTGTVDALGVEYDGVKYQAFMTDETPAVAGGIYAVRLVIEGGDAPADADVVAYYTKSGNTVYAD